MNFNKEKINSVLKKTMIENNNENRNEMDESVEGFGENRIQDLKNGTGKVAKRIVKEAAKKAIKKALKAGKKMASKLIAKLVGVFGVKGLLIIGGILLAIILLFGAWDLTTESKGRTQNYQNVDTKEYNHAVLDENGVPINTGLSSGNKKYKAFYTYHSQNSYFVKIDGKPGLKTPQQVKNQVVDLYGKEKDFYLNPDMLWAFDEHLNKDRFRYPEQFLKPVSHDKDYNLAPLTDKNNKVIVKSKKYEERVDLTYKSAVDPSSQGQIKTIYIDNVSKKETFNPKDKNGKLNNPVKIEQKGMFPTGEKTEGIWDYGLAPILFYKNYEIREEHRGTVTETEKWDEKKQEKVWVKDNSGKKKTKIPEGFPKDGWMIDKATTYAGTIQNTIVQNFEDSGAAFKPFYETRTETVWISDWVEEDKPKLDESGKQLYYQVDSEGNIDSSLPPTTAQTKFPVTEKVKVDKGHKEKIELLSKFEGTIWQSIPKYEGEPDVSGVVGKKYLLDYMNNYEIYVPKNVEGEINLQKRTGKTDAELEALMESDPHLKLQETTNGETVSGEIDGIEIGSGATSQNYKNALQHLEIFEKYGEMYGVDPYILIAKSCQESGGIHNPNGGGNAVGIMQIESPGNVIKSATAYNFKQGKKETVQINSKADVDTIDENIKIGTMLFADRAERMDYNVLLAVQAYNYNYMLDKVIERYAQEKGITVEDVKKNYSDLGWLDHVMKAHVNPHDYIPNLMVGGQLWKDAYRNTKCSQSNCTDKGGSAHYGDGSYVPNILKYYASPDSEFPWIKKPNGDVAEGEGDFPTGSATGLQFASADTFIKKIWSKIENNYDYFFGTKPIYTEDTFKFKNKLTEEEGDDVLRRAFAMKERELYSHYRNMTDAFFNESLYLLLSNPIGNDWGKSKEDIDISKYFPGQFTPPLKVTPLTILSKYGKIKNERDREIFHGGIDISAPKGTDVYAVCDGIITFADGEKITMNTGKKEVLISYSKLQSISVKKGDKVKMGDKIGKTGETCGKECLHFELIANGIRIDPTFIIEGVTGGGSGGNSDAPQTIEGSEKAKKVYEEAKKWLGSWYAWGGEGPPVKNSSGQWVKPSLQNDGWSYEKGFDCSSYMMYIYKQSIGVQLPRVAEAQYRFSTKIGKNVLAPGDLVFNKPSPGADASHVMMYIGGNKVIHSPGRNRTICVKDININDPKYKFGRVIN